MSFPDQSIVFPCSSDDPLATQHTLISHWVRDAIAGMVMDRYIVRAELKDFPSGRALLASTAEESKLLLQAAIIQARFWRDSAEQIRKSLPSDGQVLNLRKMPGWTEANQAEDKTIIVVGALLRRSLPLARLDIFRILEWMIERGHSYSLPWGYAVKALKRYAARYEIDSELQEVAVQFSTIVRKGYNNETKRLATVVEQICSASPQQWEQEELDGPPKPAPLAAIAGDPTVLAPLKISLGMLPVDEVVETTSCGPDRYMILTHSSLAPAHTLLSRLLEEKIQVVRWGTEMDEFPTGRAILALDAVAKGKVLVAAMEREIASLMGLPLDYSEPLFWKARSSLAGIVSRLGREAINLDRALLFDLLLYLAMRPQHSFPKGAKLSEESDADLLRTIDTVTGHGDLTEGERFVLFLWRTARVLGPQLGATPPDIASLTQWIGDRAKYFLVPGEAWSDALNRDIANLPQDKQANWISIFRHTLTATGARPSAKWEKAASALIAALGEDNFRRSVGDWLPLIAKGRSHSIPRDPRGIGDTIHDENANAFRGFLWMFPRLKRMEGDERLIAVVALSAYRKTPGVGPRAVKVGNAAVYALSAMGGPEALGQLAMLKVRVRFGTAQKEIEKAFDAVARELQLPREEIEELSVPFCGFEQVGLREEMFGEYKARVQVVNSDIALSWFDPKGKQLKSVPAAVKKNHAEDWKQLQGDVKDLQAMISAQKDRIDSLFLEQKTWPDILWRERYIDHPVVGTVARRLIWRIDGLPVTMIGGEALDLDGKQVETSAQTRITLWHPIGRPLEEVIAWRRRVEELGIVQPFKQAHREVYLITDAERRTEQYSNRFAAHILRQHQFNALCGARHWKNKLRLMVDDEYPPASREIAPWRLRAEFWIEGIGDNTNEAGVYLWLASDQVRFYRTGAALNTAHAGGGGYRIRAFDAGSDQINEPIRIDDVPELVFSEIMRDVDLFVGVASIGNDPAWQDGGRDTRYGDYWRNYSFGELSATAVLRRQTLERLIPRLKIAKKCEVSDRFLFVQGTRRRYKIHLGSGNILMEPNDQYLCIVPNARTRANASPIYLPFEGDTTLSIILSKAFLLADDSSIKDPVILRQLGN